MMLIIDIWNRSFEVLYSFSPSISLVTKYSACDSGSRNHRSSSKLRLVGASVMLDKGGHSSDITPFFVFVSLFCCVSRFGTKLRRRFRSSSGYLKRHQNQVIPRQGPELCALIAHLWKNLYLPSSIPKSPGHFTSSSISCTA